MTGFFCLPTINSRIAKALSKIDEELWLQTHEICKIPQEALQNVFQVDHGGEVVEDGFAGGVFAGGFRWWNYTGSIHLVSLLSNGVYGCFQK